ncbi:AfsR/SARP family transcriptional regulator [Antrihabitans spumae]|uniref:BTAD domain-containing putative transcriptional regulator n=1 Tax=Antrihabitans spumae TaxID=3373370 RepID=A0ABW7KCX4_9NOCA
MRDGNPLKDAAVLGRTSARTLLKWFLLHPGVRVESATLCEILWPDKQHPSNPTNRLHVTLHYLRHLLEPGLAARQPSAFIRSDGKGWYYFDFAGRWWTDVGEVERLFAEGKAAEARADAECAIASYERLLDYYDRTFLTENLFDKAFDSSRTVHDVAHHTAESRLLRLYLAQGLTHKALSCALSVLDRDPYSEEASMAIAEVSLLQGNTVTARSQLADHLTTMRQELGVNPSPSASHLWGRINITQ